MQKQIAAPIKESLLLALFLMFVAPTFTLAEDVPGAVLRTSVVDSFERPYQLGKIWVHRTSPVDPDFYRWLSVDSQGQATIELTPGEYEARWDTADSIRPDQVILNGEVVSRYGKFVRLSGPMFTMTSAEFTISSDDVNIKFVVPYLEPNRLRGVVASREGSPIEKLRFDLYRGEAMNCASCAVTDESGQFEFVCRSFPIRLVPQDYTGLWSFEPSELTVTGPNVEVLSFEAIPKTQQRLSGAVVDKESEAPIADVWVEYRQECLNAWSSGKAKTAADGRFVASCHAGCGMTIDAWHYDHAFSRRTVRIPPNSCSEAVTIELDHK